MRQLKTLSTLALLLLAAFGCGTADNPVSKVETLTGTLQGEVQSIEGVAIQVRLLKDGQLVAHTEAHGSYELNDIEAGNYTLHISANGYQEAELNVTVVAAKTVSLDKVTLVAFTLPDGLEPGEGLNIGSKAPAFELPAGSRELYALADYTGNDKNVVLIFYTTGG